MTFREEIIGDCKLILGDCREVLPTLADESVEMMWTDPPYGHANADGDLLSVLNAGLLHLPPTPGGGAVPIQNDTMDEMREVVGFALDEAARILRRNSCCCCCCCCGGGGPRPTFAWLADRMDNRGLQFFHSTIWDKVNPGLGWRYKRQHEMVLVAHRRGGKLSWSEAAEPVGNIFRGFFPGAQREHPNEKPLWLVQGFVLRHTDCGQTVLDPFIGIEIEHKYFDIACRRIAEAYKQPRLFDDPKPKEPEQPSMLDAPLDAGRAA